MSMCYKCNGEGFIVVCFDDVCQGQGYCTHGDGELICPECNGEGFIDDDDSGYGAWLDNQYGLDNQYAKQAL